MALWVERKCWLRGEEGRRRKKKNFFNADLEAKLVWLCTDFFFFFVD
jgi:hypothetical protein